MPDEVRYADGSAREYDQLIAFPPYVSAVALPGAALGRRAASSRPSWRRRMVAGHDDIYAPGDAGDFPIKQAFLAFLQADAVADHIAAEVTGRAFRQPFDSVSMCIMEMFDKATFAQVPVELTGDPDRPVRVRPDADGDYKVGTSPVWRLGKKMLGFSVPMRFAAGEPFHAGQAWQAMDVGIKAMSGMLARLMRDDRPEARAAAHHTPRPDDAFLVPRSVAGAPGRFVVDATWGTIRPMRWRRASAPSARSRSSPTSRRSPGRRQPPGHSSSEHDPWCGEHSERRTRRPSRRDRSRRRDGPVLQRAACAATPHAIDAAAPRGIPRRLLYYRGGIHDWLTLGLPAPDASVAALQRLRTTNP